MWKMSDLTFTNHGSIGVLAGVSEAGKAWLEEHVIAGNDEIQMWGGGVVVEPRYIGAILDGAANDGLEIS